MRFEKKYGTTSNDSNLSLGEVIVNEVNAYWSNDLITQMQHQIDILVRILEAIAPHLTEDAQEALATEFNYRVM